MDAVALRSLLDTIHPMLASPSNGTRIEDLAGTHTFDTKIDGIRALAMWDGDQLVLRNRNGRDITHRYPDLEATARGLPRGIILDGEIVAETGLFQDIAKRDKQTKPNDVLRAMKTLPAHFMAFDALCILGDDVRHLPYENRRIILRGTTVGEERLTNWHMTVASDDPAFFDKVKLLDGEGVIAKRNKASYRQGRSGDWIKFKTVRSLTCIAYGYEPGKGARAHFGAMFLALIGPDGAPVPVGRVGTGFTAKEIAHLKGELDAGRPVLVEIECLNVSRDGALRHPSYKGIRTDLSVVDATLDQLDQIPRM